MYLASENIRGLCNLYDIWWVGYMKFSKKNSHPPSLREFLGFHVHMVKSFLYMAPSAYLQIQLTTLYCFDSINPTRLYDVLYQTNRQEHSTCNVWCGSCGFTFHNKIFIDSICGIKSSWEYVNSINNWTVSIFVWFKFTIHLFIFLKCCTRVHQINEYFCMEKFIAISC